MDMGQVFEEWLIDSGTLAHGRATIADAEIAKLRFEVSVTWQHGVTRDEARKAVSEACENVLADLAAADDSVFGQPATESETL